MKNIAILGYGVVGSGVAKICLEKRDSILSKKNIDLNIKYILDTKEFADDPLREKITRDASLIFSDPSVELVIETIGGTTYAYEYTKKALEAKKHVVSSNKELVAMHGQELQDLAEKNEVYYLYEAAVGGGIPLLVTIREALAANFVERLAGILNGTCNYILTRLSSGEISFEDALLEAQAKGFAERDPSDDIEGKDTARKLAILTSLLTREWIDPQLIHTEGIVNVSKETAQLAKSQNGDVKLIARLETRDKDNLKQYSLSVSPMFVGQEHPLAVAKDAYNAVLLATDLANDILLYGPGAGSLPTASAVLGDVLEVLSSPWQGNRQTRWSKRHEDRLVPFEEQLVQAFIRIRDSLSVDELNKHLESLGDYTKLDSPFESEYLIRTDSEQLNEAVLGKVLNNFPEGSVLDFLRILSC